MAKRPVAAITGLKFGEGYLEIGDPIPRSKWGSLRALYAKNWIKDVEESEIDSAKLRKVQQLEAVYEGREEASASLSEINLEEKTKAELIELLHETGMSPDSVAGTGSGGSVLKRDLIAALTAKAENA